MNSGSTLTCPRTLMRVWPSTSPPTLASTAWSRIIQPLSGRLEMIFCIRPQRLVMKEALSIRLRVFILAFEGIPSRLVAAGDRQSEYQQDLFLDKFVFNGLRNGFFIEAGADDFMLASNSLYFEEKYNWTGLLVEPVPFRFKLG